MCTAEPPHPTLTYLDPHLILSTSLSPHPHSFLTRFSPNTHLILTQFSPNPRLITTSSCHIQSKQDHGKQRLEEGTARLKAEKR